MKKENEALQTTTECAIQNVSNFVPKRNNHDNFWIEEGILYESYNTLRGMRYNEIKEVPGMQDIEKCDDSCISNIAEEYFR